MADAKTKQYGEEWNKIKQAAGAMKRLLDEDYMKLSIAAKTWFMLGDKKERATPADLEALAPRFGWSVTTKQIKDAAQLLQENLVSLSSD